MPARPEVSKCSVACSYCRLKKVKCTGSQPCPNCVAHGEQCVFPEKSTSRKRSHSQTFLEQRIASLEQLIRHQEAPRRSPTTSSVPVSCSDGALVQEPGPKSLRTHQRSESSPNFPSTCYSFAPPNDNDSPLRKSPAWASSLADAAPLMFDLPELALTDVNPNLNLDNGPDDDSTSATDPIPCGQLQRILSTTQQDTGDDNGADASSGPSLVPEDAGDLPDERTQSPVQEGDVQEHIGKASFLAICSPFGVKWVCQQLGNLDFHECASRLAGTITRSLKMTKPLSAERQPDPDHDTALLWVTAYFDESIEHTMGLVPRQAFYRRLQQHYSHPLPADADPTWYSLRNTVFAIGSRLALCRSGGPMSYTTAKRQSWLYFENALAVHANLVYMHSDITAIECITLMALYCEAISAPSLEYMLLATAVRLAYSKRLHLQPPSACTLSESEKATRKWLLWVLYFYDKHIACRSGRPSMIRDDDINVALPTEPRHDTHTDLGLLLASVRHAQISYAIERELFGTKSRPQSIEEISKTIKRLDTELRSWYADLRQEYLLYTPNRAKSLHPRISHIHFLFLQHCFHGSMCVLHSAIAQPWRKNQLKQAQSTEYAKQVQESYQAIAEASRVIVLNSQKFSIDASSPCWLVFYFPVLAIINLFLNTVRSPNNPSAQSDITLIDIVAGMFARLDYASGGHMSISFPRELADHARALVSKSREQHREAHSRQWTSDLDQLFTIDNDITFTNTDMVDFGYYEWPLMPPTL